MDAPITSSKLYWNRTGRDLLPQAVKGLNPEKWVDSVHRLQGHPRKMAEKDGSRKSTGVQACNDGDVSRGEALKTCLNTTLSQTLRNRGFFAARDRESRRPFLQSI